MSKASSPNTKRSKSSLPKNIAARIARLRKSLKQLGSDGFLVTDETNVTYLTGFTGDSSYLLVTAKQATLLSDSRYTIQIEEECPALDADVRTARTEMLDRVAAVCKSAKVNSLAIESDSISKHFYDQLSSKLSNIDLVDSQQVIVDLRAIKDAGEIELIRRSILIAEKSFAVIRAQLTGGQTELEIAHNLEHTIRGFGGTGCAFDPIVGVGPRGALPHGQPSMMKVSEHPFLLIDWGAQYRGYASDLTRILVTGKISPKLQRVYGVVLKAQQAAIRKIRPGARLSMIDRTARKVIDDAGFGKNFGHGLGHGFGLQIHEQPRLSPNAVGELQPGMVVTVEPGIYLPGWGGVRIEDDILVTPEGHEVLTSVPKILEECVVESLG